MQRFDMDTESTIVEHNDEKQLDDSVTKAEIIKNIDDHLKRYNRDFVNVINKLVESSKELKSCIDCNDSQSVMEDEELDI